MRDDIDACLNPNDLPSSLKKLDSSYGQAAFIDDKRFELLLR